MGDVMDNSLVTKAGGHHAFKTDDLFLLISLIQSFFSISCGDTLDRVSHCIIKCVIEELEKMKEILSVLDGYRFYSSSLLIIYETISSTSSDCHNKVKVKIIDFANAALPGDAVSHQGVDHGFLLGLQNLINILEMLLLLENCI